MLIDGHAHIWGPELLGVHWLQADASAGIRRAFGLEELDGVLADAGVDRVVLVAADETDAGNRLLLERASSSARVAAVVAWVDATQPDTAARVAGLREAPGGGLLRGVRVAAGGAGSAWWWSREVLTTLAALRDERVVVEVLADEDELSAIAAAGRGLPGLTLVVDHLGGPADAAPRAGWLDGIRELADVEGAHLKVSGSPVFAPDFAELLERARHAFGADRLMAGSDWPVSTLHGGSAWPRVLEATSGWSSNERAQLTGGTAARLHGVAA